MNFLFLGTEEDRPYLFALKAILSGGHSCQVNLVPADMLSEVALLCKPKGIRHVITTQQKLIPRLCSTASSKEQSVANYAGSWLEDTKNAITYLIVPPLKQTQTLPYGSFLLERYISKFTKPGKWLETDNFSWQLLETGGHYEQAWQAMQSSDCLLISLDIETRPDLSISSISYTCVYPNGHTFRTSTFVIPLPYGLTVEDYEYRFVWIARYNSTAAPKLLQNGKYDIAYLHRYHCPITNYLFDTAVAHHSWYSELKKNLGAIGAFYIRKSIYWKHEGDSGNDWDLYNYNALDSWYTAWAFLGWLHESPTWAVENYKQEFPVLIASVLMEATGLKTHMDTFWAIKSKQQVIVATSRKALEDNLATPNFNPGSPKQVGQLLKILGCADIKSTEEKDLKKAAYRHPYNQFIMDLIFQYRKAAKLVSTYLNENKFFAGRLLYSLTPYGTKTGRLASEEHAFWCGMQIQNIPRSGGIKAYLVADEGFLIGEADYAQAESRDTGYITGDTVLINNVESDLDFHKSNASMFFGVPYEQVTKDLRQLAKPVNHGANYNMGPDVLVDEMGLEAIFKAARLLGLRRGMTARMIAAHLLKCFAQTYPIVSHAYHAWIIHQVENIGLLIGATGWTRYCFGNPRKNKRDLNAYIAHPPQSLNAMTLNKAVVRVFYEVWLPNYRNFKLCCQIHDSILFQYRIGYEHLAEEVKRCMEMDVEVTDISGITRTLRVPVDIKIGGKSWQDSKD